MHRIPKDVLSRTVDGEEVLLSLSAQAYFGLNRTGTRIWKLLKAGNTVPQIAATIAEEFNISSAQAKPDVVKFLGALEESRLLLHERE